MRNAIAPMVPLLLTLAVTPASLRADPLRVTGGAFELDIEGDIIHFTGAGFELRSTDFLIYPEKTFAPRCFQCSPGELLDRSFRTGEDQLLGRGDVRIGDVSASGVDFVGRLRFDATPTPFPTGPPETDVTFTAPFSFSGAIRGLSGGEQLFAEAFTGRGLVSVNYESGGGPGLFTQHDDNIAYEFSASPVPEPGTVLLFMAGAGMTLARIRSERRRRPRVATGAGGVDAPRDL